MVNVIRMFDYTFYMYLDHLLYIVIPGCFLRVLTLFLHPMEGCRWPEPRQRYPQAPERHLGFSGRSPPSFACIDLTVTQREMSLGPPSTASGSNQPRQLAVDR